jgi:hypothetical protein
LKQDLDARVRLTLALLNSFEKDEPVNPSEWDSVLRDRLVAHRNGEVLTEDADAVIERIRERTSR